MMPEWMKIWGLVLLSICLSGLTIAITFAIVYASYTSIKDWVEDRRYKRWVERKVKKRDGTD